MTLDILQDLTASVRSVSSPVSGTIGARGRYARTPDFSSAAAASSRPASDRGVTFHFQHKAISKRNDSSRSAENVTSAAPHQAYIERPAATDQIAEFDWRAEGMLSGSPIAWSPPPLAGAPTMHAPDLIVDAPRISFGTTGATKAERQDFWRQIESVEGRAARVQGRIISELPHELGQADRVRIARDFCKIFEENGLPYWATVHAPTKSNDPRNHHLHICYHDRPAAKTEDGKWDFTVEETRRKKSRHLVSRRPWKRVKPAIVRARDWVKSLRRRHADVCNYYLARAGLAKRYDARSYRESGVAKTPTEHLGNVASAFESFGLETTRGVRNARREIAWRLHQARAPWNARRLDAGLTPSLLDEGTGPEFDPGRASADRLFPASARQPSSPDTETPQISPRNSAHSPASTTSEIADLLDQGEAHSLRAANHDIAAEILTLRIRRRRGFLERETRRLAEKEDISTLAETAATIGNFAAESAVIELAAPEIAAVAERCRGIAAAARESASTVGRKVDRLIRGLSSEGVEVDAEDTKAIRKAAARMTTADAQKQADAPGRPSAEDRPAASDQATAHTGKTGPTSATKTVPQQRTTEPDRTPGALTPEEARLAARALQADLDPAGNNALRPPHRTGTEPRGSDDSDAVLAAAIAALTGDRSGKAPRIRSQDSQDDARIFPGAMPIARPTEQREIAALETRLVALDNRGIRRAAIATRDATDLCPAGQLKDDLNRGWVVLRAELQRRGVDLETGRHDPARATDPARARLHLDQDARTAIEIQKELERQRLRL